MEENLSPVTSPLSCLDHHSLPDLLKRFQDEFREEPLCVVRVPGRVNLIGEHIDYCGFSVLPMALQQSILIAAKPQDKLENRSLKIVNVNELYKDYSGSIDSLSFPQGEKVHWHNYVLCGIRGLAESREGDQELRGLNLAVVGNIPPNSGLSSSSALVCAAALAASFCNNVSKSLQELASTCARCERYIGTEGGGMDQAIALLATPGCAKQISFNPLRTEDVKLPGDAIVVVAHSLAEANKAASDHFNQRVAECRLSAVLLAQKSGLTNWRKLTVLADVQSNLSESSQKMVELVKKYFHEECYTKQEICSLLEMSTDELNKEFLPENTWTKDQFKIRQRALHVFQEAKRVLEFRKACEVGADSLYLGSLMNQSHDSLRDLYECSHPQLDSLVNIAREEGALGARLTGAGWGGCIVALVLFKHADKFISNLKKRYYSSIPEAANRNLNSLVFSTQPSSGAVIYINK